MSDFERIDSTEFEALSPEEQEMVLGGLAAAAKYTDTGSKPTWLDGTLQDVPEAVTDPDPVPVDPGDPILIA